MGFDAIELRKLSPESRLNVRETHNHSLLIEAEYARIMKLVGESDMDTFVRV